MPGKVIRETRLFHLCRPLAAVEMDEYLCWQHTSLSTPPLGMRYVVGDEEHRTGRRDAQLPGEQVHELGQLREQLTANSLGERRVEDGNEVVGLLRNRLADIDGPPVVAIDPLRLRLH